MKVWIGRLQGDAQTEQKQCVLKYPLEMIPADPFQIAAQNGQMNSFHDYYDILMIIMTFGLYTIIVCDYFFETCK